ncbi:MAG: T9SS type A sorting domain-containing protein, partial [Saprospiraceae bacterium]|nr:T9SS type A sorting domain-containing protein [Saprospiraceae bacterium]
STYVLVIACRSNDGAPINILGFDPETDITTRSFLHGATNLAFDSLGRDIIVGSFLEDITATTGPREIKDLLINSDLMGQGSTGNFGVLYDFRVPSIAMTIQARSVGTEDLTNDLSIDVFPNPATDKVFINLELETVSQAVNVEFINAKGQKVLTKDFANIKSNKLEIPTAHLASGFYNVNIRTEEGLTSKKVMIQK